MFLSSPIVTICWLGWGFAFNNRALDSLQRPHSALSRPAPTQTVSKGGPYAVQGLSAVVMRSQKTPGFFAETMVCQEIISLFLFLSRCMSTTEIFGSRRKIIPSWSFMLWEPWNILMHIIGYFRALSNWRINVELEIIGESSSFLPISSRIEKLTLTSLLSNTIICFLGVVDLKSFFTKSKIIVQFHCNFQLSDVFQF